MPNPNKWYDPNLTLPGTPRPANNPTTGNGGEYSLSIDGERLTATPIPQNQSLSPKRQQQTPHPKNPSLAAATQTINNASISEEEKENLNKSLDEIKTALENSGVTLSDPPGAKVDPATGKITLTFDSVDDLIKFLKAMGIDLSPEKEKELRNPNNMQPIFFNPAPGKGKRNEQSQDNLPDSQPKQKRAVTPDTGMPKPIASPPDSQPSTEPEPRTPTPFKRTPRPGGGNY